MQTSITYKLNGTAAWTRFSLELTKTELCPGMLKVREPQATWHVLAFHGQDPCKMSGGQDTPGHPHAMATRLMARILTRTQQDISSGLRFLGLWHVRNKLSFCCVRASNGEKSWGKGRENRAMFEHLKRHVLQPCTRPETTDFDWQQHSEVTNVFRMGAVRITSWYTTFKGTVPLFCSESPHRAPLSSLFLFSSSPLSFVSFKNVHWRTF